MHSWALIYIHSFLVKSILWFRFDLFDLSDVWCVGIFSAPIFCQSCLYLFCSISHSQGEAACTCRDQKLALAGSFSSLLLIFGLFSGPSFSKGKKGHERHSGSYTLLSEISHIIDDDFTSPSHWRCWCPAIVWNATWRWRTREESVVGYKDRVNKLTKLCFRFSEGSREVVGSYGSTGM